MNKYLVLILAVIVSVQANPVSRLWNGIQTSETIPYHVHIWIYDPEMFTWPGSGVLVTRSHILTAAVNIDKYIRWDLGFGNQNQNQLLMITSYNAFIHENFNEFSMDNNIGIILLDRLIDLNEHIAPIALPRPYETIPHLGEEGTISAFSYLTDYGPISTVLEYGRLRTLTEESCSDLYPHLKGMTNHFFCAEDNQFNVCGGAQGAGLIVKRDHRDVLAGIVSFGSIWKDCNAHDAPGFVKISEYVDWIEEKTN